MGADVVLLCERPEIMVLPTRSCVGGQRERGADDLIGELMGANGARVLQGDRAMSHRVVFADATVVG
jgi:hypothetical protein